MTDLNEVVLIGRVTRDLDEKSFGYVGNGQARASLSIAVNRSKKVGENWTDEVSYFDVTIWGKLAETLQPNLTKGKQIAVRGFLKQDRWETDGQKKSKVTIVAESVQLLGGKNKDENGDNPNTIQPKANPNTAAQVLADTFGGEIVNEDIPF